MKTSLLCFKDKAGYGFGAIAENNMQNALPMMAMPIMNIYMGLDPVMLGIIMAITRVTDALTDPLMGYISDNTRSRWGARKPYMLGGAIAAAVCFVLVWMFPASGWSQAQYLWYFGIMSVIYFLATTVYCVPYIGFGYELSSDYEERTRLMAYRMFFVNIGGLLLPWLYYLTQNPVFPDQLTGMRFCAAGMGILFIISALGPVFLARCVETAVHRERPKIRLCDVLSTFKLFPFMIIAGTLVIGVLGFLAVSSLGTYIIIYYVCAGDTVKGAYYIGLGPTFSVLFSFALLPAMTALSAKIGKRNALIALLLFSAAGAAASWFLYTPECPYLSIAVSLVLLPGLNGLWMLLMAMTADVCEYDFKANGLHRDGVIAALFSWSGKAGITLGIALSGIVLNLTGFKQEAGAAQGEGVLLAMRLLFAIGIGGSLTFAALLLLKYPLTAAFMKQLSGNMQKKQL